MTPLKPTWSASSLSSTNSSGLTQRSTGWCRSEGRRYCVIVTSSQPALVEVPQRLADLLTGLAHAEDQVGLGHQAEVACLGQHVERAVVAERRPDPLEDARHGLDVVGQHLRPGLEHLAEQLGLAVEVRDEVLHPGVGVELVDRPHRLGVQPGAAVREVVAGDAGDGGVAEPHLLHRLRDPPRLVPVQRVRLAGVDLAEVAAPRALVAADQERRLPVLPALEDVGAAGLLAHGVQALGLHQRLERLVLRPHLRPRLDPLGLALDGRLGVADLEPEQLAAVGCDVVRGGLGHVGQLYAGGCDAPQLTG